MFASQKVLAAFKIKLSEMLWSAISHGEEKLIYLTTNEFTNVTCQQSTLLEIFKELTSGAVASSISLQSSVSSGKDDLGFVVELAK